MMHENDKVCENFINIIENKNIQEYCKGGIIDLFQALFSGDTFSGISAGKNLAEMLLHIPNVLFMNKMQRFLLGTFRNFEEQVKMAAKFSIDNKKNKEYVNMLFETLDKIDSEEKVEYFSNLMRAFLLEIIDDNLFFKLRQILLNCNIMELNYIKGEDEATQFSRCDMMIHSLKIIGLIEMDHTKGIYRFSGLAKALKIYSLSGDEINKPHTIYSELSVPQELEYIISTNE